MKKKLKRFFGFFKFSNLKAEVKALGYDISFKNLMVLIIALLLSIFIAGFLLKLDYAYCAVLAFIFFLCMPSMVITRFKIDFERRRFNETVEYMEQLIYSFHKSGKIRTALLDVFDTSNGNVKAAVKKMILLIDAKHVGNIYEDGFKYMQSEYNCSRLKMLHDYLIEVENNGGDSARSLNMLLDDIRSWSSRTLVYQQERKNVRNKITLSIFLAMASCGFMVHLIPTEYSDQIIANPMYQIGTLLVLVACILLYVVASNKIGISYLDLELDGEITARALADVKYISDYNKKNRLKPMIIKTCMLMPFIVVCMWQKQWVLVLVLFVMTLALVFQDMLKKASAVKRVTKEISKMFPAWVRNLVLYLQTENVHVSIKKSYDSCPEILKFDVKDLLLNLEKDPVSMRPYKEFLKDYSVPQLKMSVHYLYSIAQFGTEDILAQLDYLIAQNNQLAITEEKIRNEDSLAGFGILVLAPMFFAVIKLVLDLVLFLQVFTGYMASAGAVMM